MGKFVLLSSRIFAGAADLTGVSNQIELSTEVEDKDTTNFASAGWMERIGGLRSTTVQGGGQWEAGDPGLVDDATWTDLTGGQPVPWTVCPVSADVGELAWSTLTLRTDYKLGDAVGEVAPWEASGSGSSPLVRGSVAHPPGTARTADGDGTGVELGAVATGARLYAALHVLSVSGTGPSLTVAVQSDVDDTWAAPQTHVTFDAATSTGGQWSSVAGPVTDTWWRVTWTITGTSPSFLFLASLGIA